jgi:hypothetical protein
MSVVHKPNLNFDKEIRTHIPYSVLMSGSMESSIERFRKKRNLLKRKPKRQNEKKQLKRIHEPLKNGLYDRRNSTYGTRDTR